MYQIQYRFNITVDNLTQTVVPLYGNDLALDFEKESGQQFFRRKLNGKLTFVRNDYDYIVSKRFDTRFVLRMLISRDGGKTWDVYWMGYFYKTDCEFNADNRSVIVTPKSVDNYDEILSGWEKEFNLIDMALPMVRMEIVKRPMIQLYVPGDRVITCILSAMSWEQEVEPIADTGTLENDFHFGLITGQETVVVSGAISPADINGTYASLDNMNGFTMRAYRMDAPDPDNPGNTYLAFVQDIVRSGQTEVYWYHESREGWDFYNVSFEPIVGMAEGTLTIQRQNTAVYGRWVFDKPNPHNKTAYPIMSDDPVFDNRNYRFVFPYQAQERVIYYGTEFSPVPTKYGVYRPGQYYVPPEISTGTLIPIARSTWTIQSLWFRPTQSLDWQEEQSLWEWYEMGNAYMLADVIAALLQKIAPNISYEANQNYSKFFYADNEIFNHRCRLCITPKSNILKGSYSEPAQKAPITFRQITDMLKDCFRCYWFVDEQKRLRIEHISYFMRGGSYTAEPVVGIDLTKQEVKRTRKPWAESQSKYTFEKIEMPERYQFAWMDDVTQIFEGYPLDIVNGYVMKGQIEDITVRNFTSDVDYMLLNPAGCSKDGFALLGPQSIPDGNVYTLPFAQFFAEGNIERCQNGFMAFASLQDYYMYDMPAPNVNRNGQAMTVRGTKRLKRNNVVFPCLDDPDFTRLIKTFIGNGNFEKLIVNLSSRKGEATVAYDTE